MLAGLLLSEQHAHLILKAFAHSPDLLGRSGKYHIGSLAVLLRNMLVSLLKKLMIIAVIDGVLVLPEEIHRLPGLKRLKSLSTLHLHALEMKEVEESQGVQKVHRQAVGVEPQFEQEFDYLDPAWIEGGPVVGPEEHQGNFVG